MIDITQIDAIKAAAVLANTLEVSQAANILSLDKQVIDLQAQIVDLKAQIAVLQPPPPVKPAMIFGQGRNATSAASFPQGCTSVRLWDSGTSWETIQTGRATFNWNPLDNRLAECEAHGVDVLYCFGRTPSWTAQAGVSNVPGVYDATSNRPPLLSDWSNFVTAIVAHVKRADGTFRIRKWEMWNETNNVPFWNGTNTQLLAMAKAAYQIIKAADPGAIITTPTPCWASTSPYVALDTYFSMGFQNYADVVTFHGYTGDKGAATAVGPIIDNVRATMAKYNVVKPLWDTESGFKDKTLIPDANKSQWVTDWVNIRLQKKLDASYWYQWDNQTNGVMWNTSTNAITPWGTTWVNLFKAHKG